MNLLLIEPEELRDDGGHVRVRGRRRRHVEEILGAELGALLRVGVVGGRVGTGRIVALDAETLDLEIRLERDPPSKLALQLVLALPRPPVFRRLLSTIASLGIERLLVVGTARTEKSFWQSRVLAAEAIRERLLLGLEQAGDTVLPEVQLHRAFEPLVNDVLPACLTGSRGLLAHPGAARACPHAVGEPVTCFVGPEGGLLDHEVEKLVGLGFMPVDLGDRILRVEPVVPMLVGRLST